MTAETTTAPTSGVVGAVLKLNLNPDVIQLQAKVEAQERANAKQLANLRAAYALKGYEIYGRATADGITDLNASHWGLTRALADVQAAIAFLREIGGAL
jgi:hypothetical protein